MKRVISNTIFSIVLLVLCMSTGCGGGGANVLPPLPVFVPGSISDTERQAAISEVEALFQTIVGQPNAADQLVKKMKTMSQFATAEICQSGDAIGWFKDGIMYAVFTTDVLPPFNSNNQTVPRNNSREAQGRDLTGEPTAYLINAFEPARPDVTTAVANQLNTKLYDTTIRSGTVNDFMSIRNAGLLFVHAHGIIETDNKRINRFWYATSERPTFAHNLEYKQYMDSGQLSIGSGPSYDAQGHITIVNKYIITDQFLRDVGTTFAKNATWISQSCSSYNDVMLKVFDPSTGFPGVANYAGWTNFEDSDQSTATTLFTFDRLLGNFAVQPVETPKPAPLTIAEMQLKLKSTARPGSSLTYGKSVTEYGPSEFRFASASSSNAPTIIPSIESASVNETDQTLEISGHFGSASGAITLDGGNLTLQSWSETLVKVTKPSADHGTLVLRSLGGASAGGQLLSNSYNFAGLGVVINPGSVALNKLATQAFTVATLTGIIPNGAKYRWTVTGLGKVNNGSQVLTTTPTATYKAPNQDTSDSLKVEVLSSANVVLATATVSVVVGQNQFMFTLSPGAGWPENVGTHSYNDGEGQSYTNGSNHDVYNLEYNIDTTDPDLHGRVSLVFELLHGTPLAAGQVIDQALNNSNPTLIGFSFSTARYLNQPYDGNGYYDITGITTTGKMTILSASSNTDGSKSISFSLMVNKSDGSPAITGSGSCRIVQFGP